MIFVSGDDKDANAVVTGLIEEFGYGPVDPGDLILCGRMQQARGPIAGRGWVLVP